MIWLLVVTDEIYLHKQRFQGFSRNDRDAAIFLDFDLTKTYIHGCTVGDEGLEIELLTTAISFSSDDC